MSGYPMISSHTTNKEVSKRKIWYPMKYMVTTVSHQLYYTWQIIYIYEHSFMIILTFSAYPAMRSWYLFMTCLTHLLVYYHHFFGDFCIKLWCIFVDMANWHLYIIMHIYLSMYTCYVSITYLSYIRYINLQHFVHVCSFCYFSYMLFIMNTLTIDMLGIYHRYIGVTWWRIFLFLCWGIFFMWCTYCFLYYIYFCIFPTHFWTLFILWALLII